MTYLGHVEKKSSNDYIFQYRSGGPWLLKNHIHNQKYLERKDDNMDDKILNIAVITNVIPRYREGFYDRIFSRKDIFTTVYCQEKIPGMNLKTIHNKYPNNVKILKYISAKHDKLVWQFVPWTEILNCYDVVFVMGNPRVLSDLLFGSFLSIFRKKVVLWTMAHSFNNNLHTENIRLIWSRIFDFIFLYTDAEVNYLRRKGFTKNYMVGMNNGLDQKQIDAAILNWSQNRLHEWRSAHNLKNHTLVLSCARLETKNKFQQVVKALTTIVDHIPNILWCVIGSGAEQTELVSMVNTVGLSNHVRFVGELYNEDELAPWFLSSEVFIHPAAIGLSIMHAFGYGLPVVTHGNSDRHGPEYAAFEPELTGRNFFEDDIQGLAETVVGLLEDNEARLKMKNNVLIIAREKYNVDVMVERFVQIAKMAVQA